VNTSFGVPRCQGDMNNNLVRGYKSTNRWEVLPAMKSLLPPASSVSSEPFLPVSIPCRLYLFIWSAR